MLGETTATELAKVNDSQGFKENKESATIGCKIPSVTRKNIENKLGEKVVRKNNYLLKNQSLILNVER